MRDRDQYLIEIASIVVAGIVTTIGAAEIMSPKPVSEGKPATEIIATPTIKPLDLYQARKKYVQSLLAPSPSPIPDQDR